MTTTRDLNGNADNANDPAHMRTILRERAATDPAWLLVLAQYDDGLAAYPDPFQHRSPA